MLSLLNKSFSLFIKSKGNKTQQQILETAIMMEAEQAKRDGDIKNITMEIGEEFLEVLKQSFEMTKYSISENIKTEETLLETIEEKMDNLFYDIIYSEDAKFDDTVTLACSYLHISIPYINSKEEKQLCNAENHLIKCLELLNGEELNHKAVLIILRALNELAYLTFLQKDIEKFKLYLNHSKQLYLTYTKGQDDYPKPIDVISIIDTKSEVHEVHEKSFDYNDILKFLITVHNIKPENDFLKMTCSINSENTESCNIMSDISNEFLKVLKSSCRILNIIHGTKHLDEKEKLIEVIEAKMDKLFNNIINSEKPASDDIIRLARAYLYISDVYWRDLQTEDFYDSEDHLMKCAKLLKREVLDSKAIFIGFKTINRLSFIMYEQNKLSTSQSYLEEIEEVHFIYTKKSGYPDPVDIAVTIIEYNKNCKDLLEEEYKIVLERLETWFEEESEDDIVNLSSKMKLPFSSSLVSAKIAKLNNKEGPLIRSSLPPNKVCVVKEFLECYDLLYLSKEYDVNVTDLKGYYTKL